MPTFLNGVAQTPEWALINLGSNDIINIRTGTLTQAAWLASMGHILDMIHAKWPTTKIRLMRVYRSDYLTEAATYNDVWMPQVFTGREAYAAVGPDERTFLPGNVSDTTHPNAAGYTLTAAQWQAVMGY